MAQKQSSAALIDIITRHQVYLEALKNNYSDKYNPTLYELRNDIRRIFLDLDYKDFGEMPKRELNKFIKTLKEAIRDRYSVWLRDILDDIETFMQEDTDLHVKIAKETQKDLTKEKLAALALLLLKKNKKEQWLLIEDMILPANGATLSDYANSLVITSSTAVENAIKRSWANKEPLAVALRTLVGTQRLNLRDGVLSRFKAQATGFVSTAMQQATSVTQATVYSAIFDRYIWVSIIDSRTSDICRSRDGNIYKYGDGPLPPAHVNCRSSVIPFTSRPAVDDNYGSWEKRQPTEVRNDLRKVKSLTLEEFTNKLRLLLLS